MKISRRKKNARLVKAYVPPFKCPFCTDPTPHSHTLKDLIRPMPQ